MRKSPTHCPKGHPYSEDNTYIYSAGKGRGTRRVCKTCNKLICKRWQNNNKEYRANKDLKDNYGIDLKEKEAMFEAQGRKCACCGKTQSGSGSNRIGIQSWDLDHNHITGKVRSVVCHDCNARIIPVAEFYQAEFKMAYNYLQSHKLPESSFTGIRPDLNYSEEDGL